MSWWSHVRPKLMAKGMAMGIAEVVPGVSGGTIAFVTGIYRELVSTIARFGPASLKELFSTPAGFFASHNFRFLLPLAAGMAAGVLLFAGIMGWALETAPPVVWGLFFGVILVSIVDMARARPPKLLLTLGPVGVLFGWLVGQANPIGLEAGVVTLFVGGMIAVCAWLLPAVSGSFMMVVLGLYEGVLRAINELDLVLLAALAAGCATGLMLFSRLLDWLVRHYGEPTFSLLTGFMLGALVKMWPWQADGQWLTPDGYQAATALPAFPVETAIAAVLGGAGLWWIARLRY